MSKNTMGAMSVPQPATHVEEKALIEQPHIRSMGAHDPNKPRRRKLAISEKRLKKLGFDPLDKLVDVYRKLEAECLYYENWKSKKLVPLSQKGNELSYPAAIHLDVIDKMGQVADKLMRYGYARISETLQVEAKATSALIVNTTRKGETYIVNDDFDLDSEMGDDEDDDWEE